MIEEKDWDRAVKWVRKNNGRPTIKYTYLKAGNKFILDGNGERIQVPVLEDNRTVETSDTGEQLVMHFLRERVLPKDDLGSLIILKSGKYEYYRIKKVVKISTGDTKEIIVQDKDLEQALLKMRQEIRAFQVNTYVGDFIFTPDDTLYNACQKWYLNHARVQKCRPNTINSTSGKIAILNRNELKKFSQIPLKKYTRKDFQELSDALKNLTGLTSGKANARTPGTKPYAGSTLSIIWWAITETYRYMRENFEGFTDVLANVASPVDKSYRKQSARYNVMDELSMLIFEKVATTEYSGGTPYFKHGDALVFLMYSGLRKGEFCGLSKNDFVKYSSKDRDSYGRVDVNKQLRDTRIVQYADGEELPVLTESGKPANRSKLILSAKLKTEGSYRQVALGKEATEIAEKHIRSSTTDGNDYLFKPFYGKSTSVRKVFEVEPELLPKYADLQGKTGIDPQDLNTSLVCVLKNCLMHPSFNKYHDFDPDTFTVHDLRHTAISHALRMGLPIQDVALFAGHTNLSTTMGYYNQINAQMKEHAKKLSSSTGTVNREPVRTDLVFEINGSIRHYDNTKILIDASDFEEMLQGFVDLKKNPNFLRGIVGKASYPKGDTLRNRKPYRDVVLFPTDNSDGPDRVYLTKDDIIIKYYGIHALMQVCGNILDMLKLNRSRSDIKDYLKDYVGQSDKKELASFILNELKKSGVAKDSSDLYVKYINLSLTDLPTDAMTDASADYIIMENNDISVFNRILQALAVFAKSNYDDGSAEQYTLLKLLKEIRDPDE